jgi:hypothetical protein
MHCDACRELTDGRNGFPRGHWSFRPQDSASYTIACPLCWLQITQRSAHENGLDLYRLQQVYNNIKKCECDLDKVTLTLAILQYDDSVDACENSALFTQVATQITAELEQQRIQFDKEVERIK